MLNDSKRGDLSSLIPIVCKKKKDANHCFASFCTPEGNRTPI